MKVTLLSCDSSKWQIFPGDLDETLSDQLTCGRGVTWIGW